MDNGSIQVSAPSVEEAIERGLARLGLARKDVEIEVIDQGSRGLLGIGARDATVRLTSAAKHEPSQGVESDAAETESTQQLTGEPDTAEYEWPEDQVAETARQTLAELLSQMGIESQITAVREEAPDDEPPPITLNIEGEGVDVLIGRQGEVLNALQYITRLIVSREVERWVNLVVDVQRYKERRSKSLRHLADRIAERVARTKQPVALEPMPPNERRAIHIALRDHPTVTTQSVGKGDKRKVTIIPKR
jgi:spoIIIJ-associated protein